MSGVLAESVPIFRASQTVQERMEMLLAKSIDAGLTAEETADRDRYAEIDDYLSCVNRTIRPRYLFPPQKSA